MVGPVCVEYNGLRHAVGSLFVEHNPVGHAVGPVLIGPDVDLQRFVPRDVARYPRRVEAAKNLATWEALRTLPEGVKAEIIHGVLVTPPAPLPRHSSVQGKLRRFIGGAFDDDDGSGGPGGWWVFLEVDVRLSPHDIVRPDLAGWRRERLASPWDVRPIDVVPDWICEIISTSNAGHDRVTKRELYARHGVTHYWLADPSAGTLEALRLDAQTKRWVDAGAFDASARARIPPFEAIELDLSRVFPPPVPE